MDILDRFKEKNRSDALCLRYELDRFTAQVEFAQKLQEFYPDKKSEWSSLIENAIKLFKKGSVTSDYKLLKLTVRNAEAILAPIGKCAKKYICHCVGHAHIDMNWEWSWPETVALTHDTFSTVLKLMDEFPDFYFSQSQASVFKIIEEYNPNMLEKIKYRVAEGRWEILASHWVEGDKNLAKAEALARHILYTRNYMKKLFNLNPKDVKIDWAPDTFGHSLNVPTYLREGGVKYSYLHRPGSMNGYIPPVFWWKSPNGSKVLVRNDMKHGYSGRISSDIAFHLIDFVKETKAYNYMFVYGVGDHGGGPTRNDLHRILDMASWPIFPTIKFSTANSFFESIEKEAKNFPVLTHELNVEFTGCYTSQALIKKANRFSENHLIDAEFAATLGYFLEDIKYPKEKLEKSWHDCLFNHFHDILPGSGIQDTVHYTMGLYQDIMANTSMIESLSYRKIASKVNTSKLLAENNIWQENIPLSFFNDSFGAGVGISANNGNLSSAEQSIGYGIRPFVIFNSTSQKRLEVIEVNVWENPQIDEVVPFKDKKFSVKTFDGKFIPAQFIKEGNDWGHYFVRLAFPVEVDGFGYSLYSIIENKSSEVKTMWLKPLQNKHQCFYSTFERSTKFGCENSYIRLEINPHTGAIKELYDKESKKYIIFDNQKPLFEFGVERPSGMSSWLINYSNKSITQEVKSIEYSNVGPYKISIKVDIIFSNSSFSVTYELEEKSPLVKIKISGTWLETGSKEKGCPTLRMPFAFNLKNIKAEYEIPYGSIERDCCNDEELPALQWAKVTGTNNTEKLGCMLINDSKYGYSLNANSLNISLLRSAYEPDPTPDLGQHEINLGLLPFSGELSTQQSILYGDAFNRNLKIIGTDIHDGNLPIAGQFIKVSAKNIVVSVIKKAENKDAIVLRLYETEGKKSNVDISISKDLLETVNSVKVVDLMEGEIDKTSIFINNSRNIQLKIFPYSILSILVE